MFAFHPLRVRAQPGWEADLEEINRSIFAQRSLEQQFTIQARGERLGAATWRALAQEAARDAVRQTFVRCAQLEEESASYLESLFPGGA